MYVQDVKNNVPATNIPQKSSGVKFKGEAYQKAAEAYRTEANADEFEYAYLQGFNRVPVRESQFDMNDYRLERAYIAGVNDARVITSNRAAFESRTPDNPERWRTEKMSRTKGQEFEVKSVSDIISKLEHDFGIPISSGHMSERKARGIYKVESEAVRTKDLKEELSTIAGTFTLTE